MKRRPAAVLLPAAAMALTLCAAAPAWPFATHDITPTWNSPNLSSTVGSLVLVTISVANNEPSAARGYFFTVSLPEELGLLPAGVRLDGNEVPDTLVESGRSGDLRAGWIPHRWVLDDPSGSSPGSTLASGQTLQIDFYLVASRAGTYTLGESSWAAVFGTQVGFGFAEDEDLMEAVFTEAGGRADPSGQGAGGCFIATAVFGSPDHPAVLILRRFRDRILLRMPFGPRLVGAYYRFSPPAARWLEGNLAPRLALRAFLTMAACAVWFTLHPLPWAFVLASGWVAARLVRRRRPPPAAF